MAQETVTRLALLIDADNISYKMLDTILNEVPRHGIAPYRRIYGDFTDPQQAGWRSRLLHNAIMPIQQFSNVKSHEAGERAGKNATDSTLIIDAMDILYAGKVDGFVIVSSDSDFTRLAQRLRESNMQVIGMGRNHTATSFRNACTTFVNIEYLNRLEREGEGSEAEADVAAESEPVTDVSITDVEKVVAGIVRSNESKGLATALSTVGSGLKLKFPDFDVRNYGYTKLSQMIGDMKRFQVTDDKGVQYVTIANAPATRRGVSEFIVRRLKEEPTHTLQLNTLAQSAYAEFPGLKVKDLGYAQFWKFVDNIDGVKVVGKKNDTATLER